MTTQSSDRGPNPLMIFALISVVLVTVGTILFGILVLNGLINTSSSSQRRENGPYGIVVRPLPTEKQARDLFPEKLGDFRRTAITGTIQDFKVTFTKGSDRIDIAGSQAVNVRLAQSLVSDAGKSIGWSEGIQRQLETDPSYIMTVKPPIRLAYSRGRYFFDMKASSLAALDEFMKVFKY